MALKQRITIYFIGLFLMFFIDGHAQEGSIVLPKNEQHLYTDSTLFSWNVVNIASYYHLQIATDSLFNTLICDIDVYTEDTTINGFTHPNTYYWRVKSDKTSYTYTHVFHYYLPTDFSQLIGWYSADSVHLVNGYVDTLYDKSDKLHHVVQSSVNSRPLWIAQDSTLHNHPSIYFDGNDLLTTYGNPALYAQPNAFFVITKIIQDINYSTIFSGKNTTYRNQMNLQSPIIGLYAGKVLVPNKWSHNNLYHLYYAYFNTTSSFYICLNDTLVKGNAGDFSMQMASLGGIGGTGRYYLNGFIPELIAYNKSLSSIENYHINNYISDKYFPPVDLGKDTSLIYKQDSILSKDLSIYQSCIWSTGDTTPQITLKRGIYWVKVKDYFGRESIDTIMIGESYLEPLLKNNPYIFCPKDTLQIFYQELCQKENIPYYSNYSYQWSNGQSGSNFYTTEYGSYHLTITSPRGYSITATFDVMIDSFPSQVKILTDSLCVGNNVRLLYPSDSLFLYQIVWNKTDTIQQLPFLQTSQIYVEVTNQRGCVGRDTQLIISKGNAPIVSFTTANVCLNQVTEFTNNSYTTDTSVISDVWWNFGDNDSLYSNNATEKQQHLYDNANIYAVSLKCKTNLGCENSFRQTVAVYSLPKTDFSPKQGCEKTDFVFNNTTQSAYPIRKYLWTINDRDTMSAINPTCRFDSVGMIKVELIAESIWGCKDTIFHQVEIKPSPQPIMTYNSLCVGQNVNFLDNTPSTSTCPILARKWYVNNQQVSSNDKMTYMFSQDGQYQLQLQVQYLNGCMNQQTNLLTFYPKPKADFTVSQPCILQPLSIENKARVFTPNSFSTYAWHIDGMCFYDSLPQIKLKEAGTFLLTQVVTDEQGCSDTVEQTIQIYASPRADFTYQYNADNPYAIDFQHVNNNMDNVMYSWYFMDKDSSIEEYPIYDFEKEGDYQVRLIVNEENGTCKDTIDKLIHVEEVNIDLEFVNFSLQEENLGVRPIVWLLNKSNRNLAYMDYRFVYEQEWVQERDTTTLQIGTMNKYAFTALEKKQPTATHICIEAYSPYDMYKDSKLPETYCLVLTEQLQVFDIYPNPVNDRINVQFIIPEATTVEMKLCDMMGNVLYNDSQYYTSGVHYKTLSINEFASGVYVVQVCTKNRVVSKKIIKI